ncbi:MAG: extracellular solute-binding protein [Devosia sp.]|nr:extracellular solute-binding protein [Devosia sp.]
MTTNSAGLLLGLTVGIALGFMATVAVAADPVTINVWSDTPRLPTFKAYQDAHPDVKLNITTIGDDMVAKLQLALRAHSEIPDVIFMADVNYAAQLSTRRADYLMDLTDKVSKDMQAEFYPNSNVPCMINGKLMCLRNDMAHMLIWYDKPQLDTLGVTVPTTWEEFEKTGTALAKQGLVVGSGTEPTEIMNMLVSDGCDVALPDLAKPDTLKIDLTTEACKKPAEMIDRMVAAGALSKSGVFEPAFINLAKAGKVPMMLGPTWFAEFVVKPTYQWKPKTLADALPPKWADQKQPSTWSWGGGTYGGWKDTKHSKEVVDLLTWVATNVDSQKNAVTMPADKPASIAWGEKLKTDGYYAADNIFDIELQAAQFGNPGYGTIRVGVTNAIAKVVTPQIANGGKLVDLLPALQQELTNDARVQGYTIEK